MKKRLLKKASIALPVVICLFAMMVISVFAYQGSGGSVSFTLDNVNKKYTNRNASSSWNAPSPKSFVYFQCNKANASAGTLKTLQCVEQKTILDHVVFERNNVSASVAKTATSSYHNSTNRTFAYAEWKSGVYQANVNVSW